MKSDKIKVGLTTGDPAGIGLEIIIKTFTDQRMLELCTPILYGSAKFLKVAKKQLANEEFQVYQIKSPDEAMPKKFNVINACEDDFLLTFGQGDKQTGKFAFQSLQKTTEAIAAGHIDVMVTAPIDKLLIQSESFKFPGHTEYLAKYANVDQYLMLMTYANMRVGTVTGHIPVQKVSAALQKDIIVSKLEVLHKSLKQDFDIVKPRIAVLGLNPHAGDNGLLGDEEQKVIIPAIRQCRENDMLVFGPFAADGFFANTGVQQFDAVLAMYHDQGLIPFKAITRGDGINYTAGLPIVRTSPDHGTAFDIAGKGVADETSYRNAVYAAIDIYKTRRFIKDINKNKLTTKRQPKE